MTHSGRSRSQHDTRAGSTCEVGASDWIVGANETSSKYADHRQVIGNLKPLTDHELRVVATNLGGRTVSPIIDFTTLAPPPPVISDIKVAPDEFRAVVTFSLDAKGPARTEYRKVGASVWIAGPNETSSKFKDHRQVLKGLRPETAYQLRVIATNAGGRTVSDIVPFKTKVRTVDCDQGEDLQQAIAAARDGDTLIVNGWCSGGGVVSKDLTLRGGKDARVFGGITAAAGAAVTVDGIPYHSGGTNRGRLTLIDSTCGLDCDVYVNAAGAVMVLVRSEFTDYDQFTNEGIFEATDSALHGGGCVSPVGLENRSTGSMTLRRTSIAGYIWVFGNSGSAVLDGASMEGVDGAYTSPIRNSGTMTIRDSRFINNSGDPASVVQNRGTLTVVDSLFRGNSHWDPQTTSDEAAAIVNTGDITLRGNTFIDNTPADCIGC